MAAKQFQASQSLLGATLLLRSSSIREGKPFPARRDVGRPRRELRAVFRSCYQGRALPVRRYRARRSSNASSFRNIPTRSGTAICRMRVLARSMAIACTGPTSLTPGTASTRTSCLIDPYAKQLVGELQLGSRTIRLTSWTSRQGYVLRRARQRGLHAEMPGD